MVITNIHLASTPRFGGDNGCNPYFKASNAAGERVRALESFLRSLPLNGTGTQFFDSRKSVKIQHKNGDKGVDLTCLVHVRGNVKLGQNRVSGVASVVLTGRMATEFFDQDQYKFDTPMFHFWLNTSFIEHNYIKLEKFEVPAMRLVFGNTSLTARFSPSLTKPTKIGTTRSSIRTLPSRCSSGPTTLP